MLRFEDKIPKSLFPDGHTDLRLCPDKSQSDFHPHSGQDKKNKLE